MEGKDWAELLKFPLTIIVTIIAIVIASLALGVKPTGVEVGELKVKLTEIKQDLVTTNIDIEETVKLEVERQLRQLSTDSVQLGVNDQEDAVQETVSDQVADLARIKTKDGNGTVFRSTVGYIWVGNYNPTTQQYSNLKIDQDQLDLIKVGHKYFVNGNMVIRENSPVKNPSYYHGEKKVGLAVKGAEIKILEQPEVKKLSRYNQYWVKIEVLD